jgi:hypothetical protein
MSGSPLEWMRSGLIFRPRTELSWQASHAALPTRLDLGNGIFRVFFSSRDADNRAHVGRFDIDLAGPIRIFNAVDKPVLAPGEWGYFDDHGVQCCSIATASNGDLYMYYLGWNTGKKEPLFYAAMGLAISKDGGETFQKYSVAPIMQRSRFDPWMVSGGTVLREGSHWIMYYLSGFRFEFSKPSPTSWYDVKIARSDDGIEWSREGDVALALGPDETNISRMTLDTFEGGYRAWFPVKRRGIGYRCGYAESPDGQHWQRQSGMELPPGQSGWDSEAIDKMEVIRYGRRLHMLYNGNSFGRDGIGLAYADL